LCDVIWPGENILVPGGWALPNNGPYMFVSFGNSHSNPNYDELVQQVALMKFDAVVGDITIVTNRLKFVDFTQPYIEVGLAVVAPSAREKFKWHLGFPATIHGTDVVYDWCIFSCHSSCCVDFGA
jgi:hypothetical protein